tara:strand:+ start:5471 stop:5791 length:321 start_codon:yes stop_codon:yes gene_type:complete
MDEYHSRPISEQTSTGSINDYNSISVEKKPAVSLSKNNLTISLKKPSVQKTKSESRKARRAQRIAGRIQKKIDIGTRELEAGNKTGARDKARRVARMQKRANRLLK